MNARVDAVFNKFYFVDSWPYWHPSRNIVYEDMYESIEFPFFPVDGAKHTGPFRFMTDKLMSLDDFLAYAKSGSAYISNRIGERSRSPQRDCDKGISVCLALKRGNIQRVINFPFHLLDC